MERFTIRCTGPFDDDEIQKIELYCPNGCEAASYATYWRPDGTKHTVPIDPRLTLLFFLVFMARYKDMTRDQPDALGWRLRRELADEIGKMTTWRVEESTITKYISLLNKVLAGLERKLFETHKKRGIRIADNFEITLILGRAENDA